MGRKRVNAVPNMMISYESIKTMKYVKDPKERLAIYDSVFGYFLQAREIGVHNVEPKLYDDYEYANDIITDMTKDISEGIEKYWKIVERNIKNNEGGAPMVHQWGTNGNNNKEKENKDKENNKLDYIRSTFVERVLSSDSKTEFLKIVNNMRSAGFELTETFLDGIARKILFDCMDEYVANQCIEICQRDGIYEEAYFFKVFNNGARWCKI